VEPERKGEVKMSSTTYTLEKAVAGNLEMVPASLRSAGPVARASWSGIPIPPPRPRVMGHIRDVIFTTGDQSIPLHFGETATIGGFRLPGLGAALFGTACRAPLLAEEAERFRALTEDHVLVVRLDDEGSHGCRFTVDIFLAHAQLWLLRYRLWQHYNDRDFWLVPTQGEGRSLRISHGLLALSPRAPFFSSYERNYGFDLAAVSLEARRGGY
jgi:hypothetical protein